MVVNISFYLERNEYEATVMIVHFSMHSCTFFWQHSFPQNAIIRVEVCDALGWFLKIENESYRQRVYFNGLDQ